MYIIFLIFTICFHQWLGVLSYQNFLIQRFEMKKYDQWWQIVYYGYKYFLYLSIQQFVLWITYFYKLIMVLPFQKEKLYSYM
jgi:hypothetical protein